MAPFQHLTVIGLGLIGGSIAMAAKEKFPELPIRGIDTQASTLQFALKHNIADSVLQDLPEAFEPGSLIVLACHLDANIAWLEKLADNVRGQDVTVTDIGSCKTRIYNTGDKLLPKQFIAGHPMSGKELSGIENATPLLYVGKKFILAPNQSVDVDKLSRLEEFITGLGSIILKFDPAQHDRIMAYVSHWPQLYAVLLANLLHQNQAGRLLQLQGGGIADQLRLTGSPVDMWEGVFLENRENLSEVMDQMIALLQQAKSDLARNPAKIREWFEVANTIYSAAKELQR